MSQIIAIDPGTHESALVIWDGERVVNATISPNANLLDYLRIDAPQVPIACEMVACYGMAVGAEVFETCLTIGRIQEIWTEAKMQPFRLVYRREVKMHLCGTMKAKDANIRQALIDRFGPVGTKKNPGKLYGIRSHLWAALAVAVTAHDTWIK